MANLAVIYAGGTFGMQETSEGLVPVPAEEFSRLLQDKVNGSYTFLFPERIVDSTEATLDDWNYIARLIHKNYNSFDGFIIIHGTDTMDYFCAGLDCMLKNVHKPVVCTGSMKSLFARGETDAIANFEFATKIAEERLVPGISFAFAGKVYRPDSIFKYTTEEHDAFRSVLPPLIDEGGKLSEHFDVSAQVGSVQLWPLNNHILSVVSVLPGFSGAVFVQPQISGFILEGMGNGNVPRAAQGFLKAAQDRNVPVFTIAGPPMGRADTSYAAGNWLHEFGVVPLGRMTRAASIMNLQEMLTVYGQRNMMDVKNGMIQKAKTFG